MCKHIQYAWNIESLTSSALCCSKMPRAASTCVWNCGPPCFLKPQNIYCVLWTFMLITDKACKWIQGQWKPWSYSLLNAGAGQQAQEQSCHTSCPRKPFRKGSFDPKTFRHAFDLSSWVESLSVVQPRERTTESGTELTDSDDDEFHQRGKVLTVFFGRNEKLSYTFWQHQLYKPMILHNLLYIWKGIDYMKLHHIFSFRNTLSW